MEVDDRVAVQAQLQRQAIPTAVHYPTPLHLQPAFSGLGLGVGAFPLAERAAQRVMSLPMHPLLEEADLERVVAALMVCTAAP